ncbi:AMP-binding protein [bacterium]|nr:AMP-binding protein [bacterium]
MKPSTIYEVIKAQAERSPQASAILAPQRTPLTYDLLRRHIIESNTVLSEMGIGRHDCVAMVLPNGPEMAVAFLAVAASAKSAPLNPNYRRSEFDFYLSDLQAKALLIPADMDSPAREVAESRGLGIIELETEENHPAGLFTLADTSRRQAVNAGFSGAEDVALVLHTSGTTSRPKMVPLAHRNLCTSADNICRTLQLTPSDRCLNVMPLFHIHGLVAAVLSSVYAGSSVVCTGGFDHRHFFDLLSDYEPTWYTAVPTLHQAVLKQAASHSGVEFTNRLRFIRSSSAALPPRVMAELERVFDVPVIESYGMTEAAHQMCSNPLPPKDRKAGSVGLAAGPEVAILDEDEQFLPVEEEGEIVIHGPNVMSGYANAPLANEAAFIDGWFRTGDLGRMDKDGYLFVTGRIKEIINKGGEKISPREIDEVLLAHSAVTQAVTFSVPHLRLGEDVAACVVLRENVQVSPQDIQDHARARLADYKVPSQIIIVDKIPKGPTGKLQRIGLHEKLADLMKTKHEMPANSTEDKLRHIWTKVLGVQQPGVTENFFALGGDSLLAVELLLKIEKTFKRSFPVEIIFQAPTIRQLGELINNQGEKTFSGPLFQLQNKGDQPPLFLIPGADSNVISFRQLAYHLDADRPIYGLKYPGLDGKQEPLRRIEDMATEFVSEMLRVQPQGPYYLCGRCIGGMVVYEIARQLLNADREIAMLVMLDSFAPGADPRLPLERRRARLNLRSESNLSQWIQGVEQGIREAARNFQPEPYEGSVTLFQTTVHAERSQTIPNDPLHGWGNLASGGVKVYRFKCGYPALLREPQVRQAAARLKQCLREALENKTLELTEA